MTADLHHPITPASPGAFVMFRHDNDETHTEAVLAWDAAGRALVLDSRSGTLTSADSRDRFAGVNADNTPATIIAAPPTFTLGHHNVVGFLIDVEGFGRPLVLDGWIVRPAEPGDGSAVQYHPAEVVAP